MACAFCCFRDLELTSSSLLMGDALAKRLYNVALLLEASVANVKEHDSSRSESTLTSGVCRDVLTHVSMQRYALHIDSNEQCYPTVQMFVQYVNSCSTLLIDHVCLCPLNSALQEP